MDHDTGNAFYADSPQPKPAPAPAPKPPHWKQLLHKMPNALLLFATVIAVGLAGSVGFILLSDTQTRDNCMHALTDFLSLSVGQQALLLCKVGGALLLCGITLNLLAIIRQRKPCQKIAEAIYEGIAFLAGLLKEAMQIFIPATKETGAPKRSATSPTPPVDPETIDIDVVNQLDTALEDDFVRPVRTEAKPDDKKTHIWS